MPDLVANVRTRLTRWVADGIGPGVVVAVSGGGDSVTLLRVLHELAPELALQLSVAHLNHGVRGEEAEEDARFVADLAGRLALPFDLGHWSPTRSAHFEAEARRARYAWLVEVAKARGASAVAVGHTRDDQAETILHRILRGTGLRGLAGIPSRRPLADSVTLIRPLLDASRAELRDYLASLGQTYRDDATNADLSRTRSRLRQDLMPRLAAEYNPRVADALVRLGRLAAQTDRTLSRRLATLANRAIITAESDRVVLDRAALRTLPSVLRVELLREVWRRQRWPERPMDAAHWRRLATLALRARGRASLVGGMTIVGLDADRVELRATSQEPITRGPEANPVRLPGATLWDGGRLVATLEPGPWCHEIIDLDRLVPPLRIGPPEPGERFDPLGMGGRHQPLGDFLRGRRIAAGERPRVPVLRDAEGIVWVVGHRIAHRVRRTEDTRRLLGLRWEAQDGSIGASGCG